MIKQFKLGALDYSVSLVEDIDESGLGRTYPPIGSIAIANTWRGKPVSESSKEQTLYHEVTHAILDELGYSELSQDETFVQGFSLLLHQFETSKK